MAYRRPGVKVTQEFVGALPALAAFALPNVQVGPAYQVISARKSGDYDGTQDVFSYPDQIAGTIIDLRDLDADDLTSYPVVIGLKNVVARILNITGNTGEIPALDLTNFTDATSDIFADVLPGDVIVVTGSGSGNDGSYTVREKIDNNTLKTNETFTAAEAGLDYSIRRNLQATIGTIDLPTTTSGVVKASDGVTLPAGLTYTHDVFGSVPILSAEVLLSYRALRFEHSADIQPITRVSELQEIYGTDQIVPENTLAFAVLLALNNSATETNLLELPRDYLDTGSGSGDELLAYQSALDVLVLTDMYAIGVCTHNTAVHGILKSHVNTLSQPERKKERVGIINRQIVLVAAVTEETTTDSMGGISGPSGGPFVTFTDLAASFITDGVVPGHYVKVLAPSGVVGRYKIASVDSQTQVTLQASGAPTMAATNVTYYVDKDLTKNDQANIIAAYAAALAARRLVLTWPDVVKIPVGSTPRRLPGYFLNASICALTTGLPTQQGLTNLSVATYSGVVHSTKYFTEEQLDLLAAGGVMIFVQDVLDVTALYVRHQLTTDVSAIKFQEYSITKNVDFIAKFIRDNHKQFIGQYNIVDSTLDDLKANATGIITFLRDRTKVQKLGGVIRGGTLTQLIQDPVNIDTVLERYSLDIPIPLNNLDITIVV